MKVDVELVYDTNAKKDPKPLTVEVRDGIKGARLINAIDSAVGKSPVAREDADWVRWNLVKLHR